MDTLHSVLFYAFAAITVGGGLAAALLGGRNRALGVAAVAIGLAGLVADLDAGYAALVTFTAFALSALLLLSLHREPVLAAGSESSGAARQAGAAMAAVVFAALAYAAFRGSWFAGHQAGGSINTAALGRLLLGRDAIAVEAAAAALVVAVAATGLLARVRLR